MPDVARLSWLILCVLAAVTALPAAPASAQQIDQMIEQVLPTWLTGEERRPAPRRRSYVRLPDPAPLPPERPAQAEPGEPLLLDAATDDDTAPEDEPAETVEGATEDADTDDATSEADTATGTDAEQEPATADTDADAAGETSDDTLDEALEETTRETDTGTTVPVPPVRPEPPEPPKPGEPDIAEKGEIDPGFPAPDDEAACRLRLKARGIRFEEEKPISSGKACAIPSAIRVSGLSPSDPLSIPALLNCRTAEALADWYFDVVKPAARRHFDASPAGLRIAASYVCRNRNGSTDGPISEHAFGNAVDVSAILFKERGTIEVEPRRRAWKDGFFLREINAGACAMFSTVLGPESDAAHQDHFHLDLKQRDGDYRLCQ